jgi:hypothetical protein
VASRPICRALLTFAHNIGNTVYFPAAICFMRFRALPAWNHSICCSFIVWFKVILSTFPSECLISAFTGCNIKKHSLIIHLTLIMFTSFGLFQCMFIKIMIILVSAPCGTMGLFGDVKETWRSILQYPSEPSSPKVHP